MDRFSLVLKIAALAIVIAGVFYFSNVGRYPNQFEVTDVTSKILTSRHQNFSGATLINLDDDPEQEIFIAGYGSRNLLLKRMGEKFIPLHVPKLEDVDGLTFSVSSCDLDQDGRDELLLMNRPDPERNVSFSRILKYKSGQWIDLLSPKDHLVTMLQFSYGAACIDRKGDGKYGLAISHQNGKIMYLEMINNIITNIAKEIGIEKKSKGRSIIGVPGPRGRTNLFVGNEGEENFYFENKGDGSFRMGGKSFGLKDPGMSTRGASLIDLNQDDFMDLVYSNYLGSSRLLEQTKRGNFLDATPKIMKDAYAVNSTVVADFNLDGHEDIYFNNARGHNKMFVGFENSWHELDIPTLAEKDMYGVSTIAADLDHNGSFEILNVHGDGTDFPITLYTVKPEGKWVKFTVTYPNGGIPRGAMIKFRTNQRQRLHAISSGSGRFANYGPSSIFALAPDEIPLSFEVTLPSGKRYDYLEKINIRSENRMTVPKESSLTYLK